MPMYKTTLHDTNELAEAEAFDEAIVLLEGCFNNVEAARKR